MPSFHLPPADQQPGQKDAADNARRPYTLAREIVVILAIKISLLFVIWYFFFSAPQAHNMQVPAERMQQRLIDAPAVPPTSNRSYHSGTQDHATR